MKQQTTIWGLLNKALTESQKISSWKGPIRILKSNSPILTGSPNTKSYNKCSLKWQAWCWGEPILVIDHGFSEGPSPNIQSGSRRLCKVKCLRETKMESHISLISVTQVHFSAKPWVLWAQVTEGCCSSLVLKHSPTHIAAPSSICPQPSQSQLESQRKHPLTWDQGSFEISGPMSIYRGFIHRRGMKCNSITDTQGCLTCHKECQKGSDKSRWIWILHRYLRCINVPSKEQHLKGGNQPPRPVMLCKWSRNEIHERLTGGKNEPFKQGSFFGETLLWLARTPLTSQRRNKNLRQRWRNPDPNLGKWSINLSLLLLAEPLKS